MKDKSDYKDFTAKPRSVLFKRFWGQTNSLTPYFPLCALFAFAVSSFIFWAPIILAQDEILSLLSDRQTAFDDTELYNDTIDQEEPLTPARQRTEMEIRTSTLSELALWCRNLGLSESGTRAELSQRLREYFNLPEPMQNEDRRIITIESAQVSEYFTIDVIDEDYARLTGNVSLRLIDENTIHSISADEILFNRTRNILTARGNVIYEKTDSQSTETFKGENITVNLDNWSSILLDGSSARGIDSGGGAYLFSGSVISRSDDVTVLSKATVTNAANEEALWSITASRIWLLPGSDFAILNAVLKVGEIPVLYIPFFYYPGDQIFFHPVIGYRSREGGYVQTTTYILGQPRSDPNDTNSISRILGNSDNMEKELEGLFLRSTGRKMADTDSINLKILIDYYVNLGAYLGLEINVPKTGVLNPLEFSAGLGFTRTVSLIAENYTPYNNNGLYDWNHSSLFSLSVPFRYRMNFNSSITGKYGSLSWSIPFYSDPFVNSDFLDRSENMDWINMIQQGASENKNYSSQSEIRLYQWHVNGNLNFTPSRTAPFISRISLSNISTTVSFRTKNDTVSLNNPDSPQRFFFAPDKYTIYNISGSISGTPYTYPYANSGPAYTESGETDDPLNGIGVPVSPWAQSASSAQTRGSNASDGLSPPVLNQVFNLPRTGNTVFSIDYYLSPSSSTELQFLTNNWKSYEQVDWSDTQSILTSIGGNGNVNFRINHTTGLYTNIITLFANGTWRDYGFLNKDAFIANNGLADENRMNEARKQQYSQTNYSTSYAYTGTIRPFMENQIFSQTNFQYNLRGTFVKSKRYSGTDWAELAPNWGSWVKEERKDSEDIPGLNSNRLTANIAANIMDNSQNISISADLPPLDWAVLTSAAFRYGISETGISFAVERPSAQSSEEDVKWKFLPVYFTQTIKIPDIGSFAYNMTIKPEENNDITNITASLSLWNFRAYFAAEKKQLYKFEPITGTQSGGWMQYGDPVLSPGQLTLSYNNSSERRHLFNNRISYSFDVNTSLAFDLQRHTNSNFQLTLGLQINVPGLLELRLSATSQNSVIWRYFKGIGGMDELTFMYPAGPQNNIFTDLIDSFNFLDESKRRRSGFKIQSFNLSAVHFLGDWQAELSISMYPHRLNNQIYRVAADVSFLVQWKPITEIKSDIGFDGRNERWSFR